QRAATLIFIFDPLGSPWSWRQTRMTTPAGLNAGFLVSTDNVVVRAKGLPVPEPSIQIQYPASLLCKLRVSGKNPVFVLPGFDGIGIEYPPDRAGTDGLAQGPARLHSEVRRREPTQGQAGMVDCFTRTGFHEGTVQRGKTGPSVLAPAYLP